MAGTARRARRWKAGSTGSAAATAEGTRGCAICSAARAPTWPRCAASACRCRRASPSPPRSATLTTSRATAIPTGSPDEVESALAEIEAAVGAGFGDAANPLLVSVRSGAPASMPGMMDTVLNLGLNDRDGGGAGGAVRRPPLRLRQLPPFHPDVRPMWCSGVDPPPLRGIPGCTRTAAASMLDTELAADGLESQVVAGTRRWSRSISARLPAGPQGAALGRHRRGVRESG